MTLKRVLYVCGLVWVMGVSGCSQAPEVRWDLVMTTPASDAHEAELQELYRDLEEDHARLESVTLQSQGDVKFLAQEASRMMRGYSSIAIESEDPLLASSALVRAADLQAYLAARIEKLSPPEPLSGEELEVHETMMREVSGRMRTRSFELDVQALSIADRYGVESPLVTRAHERVMGHVARLQLEEREHYETYLELSKRQLALESQTLPELSDEVTLVAYARDQLDEVVELTLAYENIAKETGDVSLAVSAQVRQGDLIWDLAKRVGAVQPSDALPANEREELSLRLTLLSEELTSRARSIYSAALQDAQAQGVDGELVERARQRM